MKSSIHVLLVEDDQDDVEFLQAAFSDNDIAYRMDIIMDGDRVLPWLEDSYTLPDVIVLDLNLPKMSGREIISSLKENPLFEEIPVIVLTTSSSHSDINHCMNAGAEKFITKPTTLSGFREVVLSIAGLVGVKDPE